MIFGGYTKIWIASVIPQNYSVDVLGQQFLVRDNGQLDRFLLFGTDEDFLSFSNSQN